MSIDLEKTGFKFFNFGENVFIPKAYLYESDATSVRLPGLFSIESEFIGVGLIEVSLMTSSLFFDVVNQVHLPILGNLKRLPFSHGMIKKANSSHLVFASLPEADKETYALIKKEVLQSVCSKLAKVSKNTDRLESIISLL